MYNYQVTTPYMAPRRAYRPAYGPSPAGTQPTGFISKYNSARPGVARHYSGIPIGTNYRGYSVAQNNSSYRPAYAGSIPSQVYPGITDRHPYYASQGTVYSGYHQPTMNQYVNAPAQPASAVRSLSAAPYYGGTATSITNYAAPAISYTSIAQPVPAAISYPSYPSGAVGGRPSMAHAYMANYASGTLGTQVNNSYDGGAGEGGGYLQQKMQSYQQSNGGNYGGQQQQQQQSYQQSYQQDYSQYSGQEQQQYQQGGAGGGVFDYPAEGTGEARHLSRAEKEKKARDVFTKYDKDGNGMMDIYEFLQAMGNLGTRLDFSEAQGIFAAFDESQQNCITIDQFASNYCANY